MNRLDLITQRPFAVRALSNGREIATQSRLVSVQYFLDGTGVRTRSDGRTVAGHWRFLDPDQRLVELMGPEGPSFWLIIELTPQVYRIVNIDTSLEFIHTPLPTATHASRGEREVSPLPGHAAPRRRYAEKVLVQSDALWHR